MVDGDCEDNLRLVCESVNTERPPIEQAKTYSALVLEVEVNCPDRRGLPRRLDINAVATLQIKAAWRNGNASDYD